MSLERHIVFQSQGDMIEALGLLTVANGGGTFADTEAIYDSDLGEFTQVDNAFALPHRYDVFLPNISHLSYVVEDYDSPT